MENQNIETYRSPTAYLKIFFRRRWFFITPLFIGLILSSAACFIMPPTWESSALILVQEERIINPLIQNLAVSTTAAQRMQSIREILLGWMSLVELTKKLDLAKNVKTQLQFENLILSLRRNIVVQMRQPNVIKISYQGKDPYETQAVAKTMTDILLEKNMESQTKETDVAIRFINEQLAIYKRKIKESEIAKLEEQLKGLLSDSTEQHPMVKELRQKIEIAKNELESDEYKITDNGQPITDASREILRQELDKLISKETADRSDSVAFASAPEHDANQAIYKLLLMDKVDSALARDINVNENIYNMLLQKLETAKITQRLETSKEGTRYTIIDPPRLPLKPIKPNKMMVILAGIFLGGVSGVGLVLGRDFVDRSFLDIEDAKENLEIPVLGAISRITTQDEIDAERNRTVWLVIIALSSAAMIIVAAILVSLFRK